FTNTAVSGQSLFAPITLQGCYRSGGTLSGYATESGPAPAVMLGDTVVAPADPQIGTALNLSTDLPYGIGLIWIFTFSQPRPTTTVEPVRYYGDPATAIVLPGMVVFQTNTAVPLPVNPGLVGLELYVQGVTLPLLGQWWVPGYHLPRGALVRPRL
ncbi:MAG: hypothetical protein KDC98_07170, partial [Planctomycetes bacterium]|nr:hypothetical protein [Planctomycetota bacterium]